MTAAIVEAVTGPFIQRQRSTHTLAAEVLGYTCPLAMQGRPGGSVSGLQGSGLICWLSPISEAVKGLPFLGKGRTT